MFSEPMDGYEFWSFRTARYEIAALACDEYMAPEDGLCEEQDIEFAREGGAHWFCAAMEVRVLDDHGRVTRVIGRDTLGGCSYRSYADFRDHIGCKKAGYGSYFSDMVREAIGEARATLAAEIAA